MNVDLQCGAILDFISNLQSAVFKARKDKRRLKQISSNGNVWEQSLIVTDNHIRLKTEQKMSDSEFFQSGKKEKTHQLISV